MSYAFSVRAPNKAAACQQVEEELSKVVASQPIHKKDQDQALVAALEFIGLLRDDESRDVSVSVSGYLSWEGVDAAGGITGTNISVTATLVARL